MEPHTASTLIKRLQGIIAERGDIEVVHGDTLLPVTVDDVEVFAVTRNNGVINLWEPLDPEPEFVVVI